MEGSLLNQPSTTETSFSQRRGRRAEQRRRTIRDYFGASCSSKRGSKMAFSRRTPTGSLSPFVRSAAAGANLSAARKWADDVEEDCTKQVSFFKHLV